MAVLYICFLPGESSTFLVLPLLGMAKVLSFIGRATKAVEVYHRVITILEANKGAESEDLVVALFGLGNLLIKEGKVADAEDSFLRYHYFQLLFFFSALSILV